MKHLILIFCICLFASNSFASEIETEKRETDPFSEISLRVSANLYIEQGDEHSISISANQKTLDKIIVEINNGKMIVRFSWEDRLFNDFKPGKIDIHVSTKTIKKLSIQGSGNIIAENPFTSRNLHLNISGSGDIKLASFSCERIEANISGSGDIILEGNSSGKEIDITIAGSGDVFASDFEAEAAYVKIAGSGDCEINVSNYLDVAIYGSGDVVYKGEPSLKEKIAGSGRIHRKN